MLVSIPPATIDKDILHWQPGQWSDYLVYRDDEKLESPQIYFYHNHVLVETGQEGINHSQVCDLLTMMLGFWFMSHPDQKFSLFSRCQIEKPQTQAAAPDLMFYVGRDYPSWKLGERRYINLAEVRVPDLVGEVGDTSIATDLDEKKHLYAELGIPEYWVIDVRAKRVIAFVLNEKGIYEEIDTSLALQGLKIQLIEQTLQLLETETNGTAAIWFSQQITQPKKADTNP